VNLDNNKKELKVSLFYVTPPVDSQLDKIKDFVAAKEGVNKDEVKIDLVEKKDLVGGFVLRVGTHEYDWSTKGRLDQLMSELLSSDDGSSEKSDVNYLDDGLDAAQIAKDRLSKLRSSIESFTPNTKEQEVGFVVAVGDGIAKIQGIDHAMYGEIIEFESGAKGMVQDIKSDSIGCILFNKEDSVAEGDRVNRTGKKTGVPVGEGFLGRVVDALGTPIDGGGDIIASDFRPVEHEAPGIIDRKSVSVPLETGILAIDSMFPIGRGQRELIIGDRQTGKTSIAVDTIINQKDKGVICVYVAIGQKASTVAKLVNTLDKHGALPYTIIMAATASDSSALQYIAPYAATSMAEYFMYKGKDVLIVYDDLSKHAVAYRALSLLLERSPGREAYPGDVFYLHSRLLERSSRLSDEAGGGSITALPIIETQAGDVSAYIPTNVISITDGQIFLESSLFFSGQRPAVNVGLSVSRVGGAAQSKAMKKASGSIRIDLAQYREMEVFTQFSSDLDQVTKNQLTYGKGLMELLKQPLCRPLSLHEQVITLVVATKKVMMLVENEQIKDFQMQMLDYFEAHHPEIIREIENQKTLSEDLTQRIVDAATQFRNFYLGAKEGK
jgi:ATP synthase F1, alpha subunit